MQLWSAVLSNNSAKVRIALAEKGLSAEIKNIPWSREHGWYDKPAEFLAVSPRAQVPVLVDGDLAVHDSTVINEYLEEKYPDKPLFPKALSERAKCRIWEDEADYISQSCLGILIRDVFVGGQVDGNEEVIAALDRIRIYLGRLDRQLKAREYICESFSVADIGTFMTVAFSQTLGAEMSGDNVRLWYNRVLSRPAVKADFEAIIAASSEV